MQQNVIHRVVAVTAVLAGLPLAAFGLRNLFAGARLSKPSLPATAVATPADPASGHPYEIRIPSGTGADIQQAIAALPPDGGRILLGTGTFTVSRPLVIDRDDVELSGDQERTILKLAPHVDSPLLVIGQMVTPIERKVRGVTVRKLTLDGNRLQQEHECYGGICDDGGLSHIRNNALTIRGATDVRIQHVTARAARSGGVVLEKGCRRIYISDFTSSDNHFDGFAAYETEESVFTRMYLHGNTAAGISADIRFDRNIVSHSRMERNGCQGIFMRDSNFNNFVHLTIDGNGAQGIFIAQADDARTTPCTGNVFSNLVVTNSKGAGLRVNDITCIANTVARSRFENNGEGGISEAAGNLIARIDVEVK